MTIAHKRQEGFPSAGHDHRACVAQALAAADDVCRRQGARLTDLRRRVLALVWDSHAPVGAYQLLERLGKDGKTAAPPTIYRALDFLAAHGLVRTPHQGQFLICDGCGTAAELEDERIATTVRSRCGDAGFEMHHLTLEILGLCPSCSRQTRTPSPR